MNRWWDDEAASSVALAQIARPGAASVGAALLGYHGLAAAALRPLAARTCVDAAMVVDALAGVDTDAVAKALGVATRDELGEDSRAYGQLLARDIHEQAVEGTTRLLAHLTSTGMDWPTALTRAAGVHGVPANRLGPVAKRLKAERLSGISLADACDRALMAYAQRLAERECGALDPVAKASRERERESFDEREHPRDERGRFTDAADRNREGTDRRRQRRSRLAGMAQRASQAKQQTLASLAQQTQQAQRPTTRQQASDRQEQRRQEGEQAARKRRQQRLDRMRSSARRVRDTDDADGESTVVFPPREPDGSFPGEVAGYGRRYMLVPRDAAEKIEQAKKFTMLWLRKYTGDPELRAERREEAQQTAWNAENEINDNAYESLHGVNGDDLEYGGPLHDAAAKEYMKDKVLLVIDGLVAWDEMADVDSSQGGRDRNPILADGGLYAVEPLQQESASDPAGISSNHDRHGLKNIPFDNLVIRLRNEDDFSHYDGHARRQGPSNHDLDGVGRFAERAGDRRASRQQRSARLARRSQQAQQAQQARQAAAQPSDRLRSMAQRQEPTRDDERARAMAGMRRRQMQASAARRMDQLRQRSTARDEEHLTYQPSTPTLVFDPVRDQRQFEELFGMSMLGERVDVSGEDVSWVASRFSRKLQRLGDVVNDLHDEQVRFWQADAEAPKQWDGADVYTEASDAVAVAEDRASLLNAERYRPGYKWLPYAKTTRGVYAPAVAQVKEAELPVIVMADSQDDVNAWENDPRAFDLASLSMDGNDTAIPFKDLFEDAADVSRWQQYSSDMNRPSTMVRAFRLRRRHNGDRRSV